MAPHTSTLAWKIPWMEEPGGLQSMGSLESDMTERLHFHFSLSCIGEGNGNLLQCSCLENPRDGEAWWATVYGVAQSWTQLKPLSSSSSNQYPCLENPMDRGACRLQPRDFSNCLNTISTQYPLDGVCKNVLPFITWYASCQIAGLFFFFLRIWHHERTATTWEDWSHSY